jgi:hypothetical protein
MKQKPKLPAEEIELRADSWQRFERAVDVVAKSPPQHRTKEKPARTAPRKRKVSGPKSS